MAVLEAEPGGWPSDPALVVVHEPGSPVERAALLARLPSALPAEEGGQVLSLTRAEWAIWSGSAAGRRMAIDEPLWGESLDPARQLAEEELRRDRLRAAWGVYARPLHRAFFEGKAEAITWAGETRDRLEQEVLPVHFPFRPDDQALATEHYCSALGALHTVFTGEISEDRGESVIELGERAPTPLRSRAALLRLVEPLLVDLPVNFTDDPVQALYLLPGPLGTRLSWQLLVVVSSEAPLQWAAGLRSRLHQHLGLLEPRSVRAAFGARGGPIVMTAPALSALVRRRLFERPLHRLVIKQHRELLRGEDVLAEAFEGPDCSARDLSVEVAALIEATHRCWSQPGSVSEVYNLLLGAWPALIHLLRGGGALDSLAEIHAEWASSPDPAQAFVGSEGSRDGWADPTTADLGRSRELLRDRGPVLARIQEVAVEAALAFGES
ncbi:MAG: hypothetical protein VX498_01030 [Myxococcota bacterium]|nr:hypothetical protein [Myxococcota bacterium]